MSRLLLFLFCAFVSSAVALPNGEIILLSKAPPRPVRHPAVSTQVPTVSVLGAATPSTSAADANADLSMRLGFGCAAMTLLFTGGTLLISLHRSLARHGKKEFCLAASVFAGLFFCCSVLALSGDSIPAWCATFFFRV